MIRQFLNWWWLRLNEVFAWFGIKAVPKKTESFIQIINNDLSISQPTYINEQDETSQHLQLGELLIDYKKLSTFSKNKNLNISLKPSLYLKRSKELPLSVGSDVRGILEHDLQVGGGINAANSDEVLTGWFRSDHDEKQANLIVVKRPLFDKIANTIRKHGFKLGSLIIKDNGQHHDLLPTLSLPKYRRSRKINQILIASSLALCFFVFVATGYHLTSKQESAIAELDALISEETVLAKAARDKIKIRQEKLERIRNIRKAKLSEPSLHEILHVITSSMPDNAWLTEMHLRGDQLRIVGFAKSAADLIRPIEELKIVKQASFTSNITRSPQTNAEQFSMQIELSDIGAKQ